jgi:hypothetical protein
MTQHKAVLTVDFGPGRQAATELERDAGKYVGRHRLSPHWRWRLAGDYPNIEAAFKLNLTGGAFK